MSSRRPLAVNQSKEGRICIWLSSKLSSMSRPIQYSAVVLNVLYSHPLTSERFDSAVRSILHSSAGLLSPLL